jgi:copper transporter 1
MLFTWDTTNLCIVFRQWHITSNLSLVLSLAAIVAICAGYEALREGIRRYEAMVSKRLDTAPRKCFTFPPSRPSHRLEATNQLHMHGEPRR